MESPEKSIYKKNKIGYTIPNPLWHQVITYIVVLFFCCITVLSCLWIVKIIQTEGFISIGGIPVIIFFAGYSSYVGLLVLRYRSVKIIYNEDSFTVISRGHIHKYSWFDITKTKYYGMVQVLRLFNSKGKTIYTIHGITRDNRNFMNKVSETVGYH